MKRVPIELLVGVGTSAVIAIAVALAGGAIRAAAPPLPSSTDERVGCWNTRLVALDRSGVTGRARLCNPDDGVGVNLEAEGLTPGVAYLTSLVYFDRPEQCRVARCSLDDALGDEPAGIAGRMDGAVANGTRKSHFAWEFRDLRLSSASQVMLLLVERGQAGAPDNRRRARQLLSLPVTRLGNPPATAADDGARLVAQAIFDLP